MSRFLTCGPRRRRFYPNVVFAVVFAFTLLAFTAIFAVVVVVTLIAVDDSLLLAIHLTFLFHLLVHLTIVFSSPHAAPFAFSFSSASASATTAFSGR
jgi:hypothetical protein